MRSVVIAMLLIVSSSAFAQSATSGSDTEALLAWHHDCDRSGQVCLLEKVVTFKSQAGMEHWGVMIGYNTKEKQPAFIAVVVPSNVPSTSELEIRFVDSVRKDGKWTLVPSGDFISLPLSGCDKTSCQARIRPQIPGGPNFFKEIQQRSFMWVLFKRGGALERFMVPLSGVNKELQSMQ